MDQLHLIIRQTKQCEQLWEREGERLIRNQCSMKQNQTKNKCYTKLVMIMVGVGRDQIENNGETTDWQAVSV